MQVNLSERDVRFLVKVLTTWSPGTTNRAGILDIRQGERILNKLEAADTAEREG